MKQFVIIGGSTGIGRSLVELLSADAHVTATYAHTQPEPLANVNYVHFDVTNPNSDFSWLPESIDGLAYCVGSITLKPFARIKPEEFVTDYQKQTLGAIASIQAALPALKTVAQNNMEITTKTFETVTLSNAVLPPRNTQHRQTN